MNKEVDFTKAIEQEKKAKAFDIFRKSFEIIVTPEDKIAVRSTGYRVTSEERDLLIRLGISFDYPKKLLAAMYYGPIDSTFSLSLKVETVPVDNILSLVKFRYSDTPSGWRAKTETYRKTKFSFFDETTNDWLVILKDKSLEETLNHPLVAKISKEDQAMYGNINFVIKEM